MNPRFLIGIVLATALATAPGPAGASHCDNPIHVLSGVGGTVFVGPPLRAVSCSSHAVEDRVILPGATAIFVSVDHDLGPSVPTIEAHVSGLGVDQTLVLSRMPRTHLVRDDAVLAEGYAYGGAVSIDPLASGPVTVTVTLPDGSISNTYRTVH